MERALIKDLLIWKEKPTRKPLVLKGVRQCGKTYLLNAFGKKYYENVAYFNFEETGALSTVFEKDYDVKRIVFELGLFAGCHCCTYHPQRNDSGISAERLL